MMTHYKNVTGSNYGELRLIQIYYAAQAQRTTYSGVIEFDLVRAAFRGAGRHMVRSFIIGLRHKAHRNFSDFRP